MKKMQLVAALICLLVFCSVGTGSANTEEYWIKVNPTVTGRFTVDVDIQTNIKKPVLLAVDLSLAGLLSDDVFIGTSYIIVPIKNGSGTVTIDGSKDAKPTGLTLPRGTYNVRATFHPGWKENKKIARKLDIYGSVEAESSVHLRASGALDESFIKKLEGQQWVMENVYVTMPWDKLAWEAKFGNLEEVEYQGTLNPNIIKLYYFKSIDVTLKVNALKNSIVTFAKGLKHT